MITGEPIDNFVGGWAKLPFIGRVGHYWNYDGSVDSESFDEPVRVDLYTALCKMDGYAYPRVPALSVGEFPRCKKCQASYERINHIEER